MCECFLFLIKQGKEEKNLSNWNTRLGRKELCLGNPSSFSFAATFTKEKAACGRVEKDWRPSCCEYLMDFQDSWTWRQQLRLIYFLALSACPTWDFNCFPRKEIKKFAFFATHFEWNSHWNVVPKSHKNNQIRLCHRIVGGFILFWTTIRQERVVEGNVQ